MFKLEFIDDLIKRHRGVGRRGFQLFNEFFDDRLSSRSEFGNSIGQILNLLHRVTPQSIVYSMEVDYFLLNRAEYYVPVIVKIPGRELALAERHGAERTLIDFIGEIKD